MEAVERIQCGGFGNHTWWEKNKKRCEKIGAEKWCAHCHKEMVDGTGWFINYNGADDSLYPMSVELEQGEYDGHRFIGNECIKNFLSKDQYAIYAMKVEGE